MGMYLPNKSLLSSVGPDGGVKVNDPRVGDVRHLLERLNRGGGSLVRTLPRSKPARFEPDQVYFLPFFPAGSVTFHGAAWPSFWMICSLIDQTVWHAEALLFEAVAGVRRCVPGV